MAAFGSETMGRGSKADMGLPLIDVRLPPKADIEWHLTNVRFVPSADIPLSLELRTFRAWTGRSIDCCARDQEQ